MTTELTAGLADTASIFFSTILPSSHDFGMLAIFFGTLLLGEIAIFFGFILAQQGSFSLYDVYFISLFSVLVIDCFWLLLGRYFPTRFIAQKIRGGFFTSIDIFFKRVTKDKLLFAMIMFKFFLGARIAYMLYISKKDYSIWQVIFYDVLANILFVTTVGIIAFVLAKTLNEFVPGHFYLATLTFGSLLLLSSHIVSKKILKSS